jgi:hypothetical protein
MRLDNYIKSCKKFAKDTKNWSSLDRCKFYTDDGRGEWLETSDNAHGGVRVDWAYGLSEKDVNRRAFEEYLLVLRDLVEVCAYDRDTDRGQWAAVLELFG